MMQKNLKAFIKYGLFIGLAGLLLWFSLRMLQEESGNQSKSEMIWRAWERSNKFYLILMAIMVTLSHVVRSIRWKTLLEPSGNTTTTFRGFLSITIGYLINLIIPRGGEISRCYNLMKLDHVPVQISIGTVVLERIVDVILLLGVVGAAFFIEWHRLISFIEKLPVAVPSSQSLWLLAGGVVGSVLLFIGAGRLLSKNEKIHRLLKGFKEGLTSVFKLKHKGRFIIDSLLIWALYFIMTYFVVLSFPETSVLGVSAALTIFALGAIAMAVPVPGGTGAYHTIVPLGLVHFYNIPKAEAISFVFVFHAWQSLIMIVTGVISLVITYFLVRWDKRQIK